MTQTAYDSGGDKTIRVEKRVGGLLELVQMKTEPTMLSEAAQQQRAACIMHAHDPLELGRLRKRLDRYVNGDIDMTAIEFYYQLERCTPLVLFHTFPRKGVRNLHRNGLQQSYGDHTRLLLLGIDAFDNRDIEWLLSRRWHDAVDTNQVDLEGATEAYHQAGFERPMKAAMWIAAALHDYGKIFKREFGLDAEDAGELSRAIYEPLCPAEARDFVALGIRDHDLVEYVITGETPTKFIGDAVARLQGRYRELALPMLAVIQFIGAASLGEGRITRRKLGIYHAIMDGHIIIDGSPATRLGRLLYGEQIIVDPVRRARARQVLDGVDAGDRAALDRLLSDVVLHYWTELRDAALAVHTDEDESATAMLEVLTAVARAWWSDFADHEHIVFGEGTEWSVAGGDARSAPQSLLDSSLSTRLLNDSRALILR